MVKLKDKKAKSKHHLDIIYKYRWSAMEVNIIGLKTAEKQFSKSVFLPVSKTTDDHPLKEWRVVRSKPNNKKYKWTICIGRRVLRHKQSRRPMRFSTPANAIIAAEKYALGSGMRNWFN